MITSWLLAFALTQVIEAPIYTVGIHRSTQRRWTTALAIALGASAITHPFVWFVFPNLIDAPIPRIAISEVFAWSVELAWLAAFRVPRPWLWSSLANGASFGTGVVLSLTLGWP